MLYKLTSDSAVIRLLDGARIPCDESNADYAQYLADVVADPSCVDSDTTAELAIRIRAERDARLAACDWTQVTDVPVDQAAWRVYRQALRDITTQPGFPANVDWPAAPQ